MPPELAEVQQWLQKAEHDRRGAEAAVSQTPPITDVAAFLCQQAVEKTLKAYLVWWGREFEKIHDLRALANLCAERDASFTTLRDRVAPLTPYAVRFRYPGPNDPTVEHVQSALAVVTEVREFVVGRLPTELRA